MTPRSFKKLLGYVGLTGLGFSACGGNTELQKPKITPSDDSSGAGGSVSLPTAGTPSRGGETTGRGGAGGTGAGNAASAAGEAGAAIESAGGAAPAGGAGGGGTPGAPVEGPKVGAWLAFDAQPDEVRGVYLASTSAQCFDRVTGELEVAKQPAISADGKRLAYAAKKDGLFQIFVRELDRGGAQQITALAQGATYPTFHPSGSSLAFVTGDPEALRDGVVTDSTGMGDLMEVDLSTQVTRLVAARSLSRPYFAPAFSAGDRLFASDTFAIWGFYKSEGSWGAPRLSSPPSVCQEPAPSPDGQWLAYPDTCETTLRLYTHRIDVGSPRSCATHSFDHTMGVVAPDWGPYGTIAVELLGPDHGLRLVDDNDFSTRGSVVTPKNARNPSWGPAALERACRQ